MKKYLSIITLMLMLAMQMPAQNFASLWKQVEKATDEDKPKSAIATLQQIQKKAISEKQYGNLIAALFYEVAQWNEISTDSVAPAIARLAAKDAEIKKNDKVASLMLHIAMRISEKNCGHTIDAAKPYKDYIGFGNRKASKSLVAELLADKTFRSQLTAANGVDTYDPLIEKEDGSKYFNHDIISLIAAELNDYEPLIDYYRKNNQREAACVAAARMIEQKTTEPGYRVYDDDDDGNGNGNDDGNGNGNDNGNGNGNEKKDVSLLKQTEAYISEFSDIQECGRIAALKLALMETEGTGPKERLAWTDESLKRWPGWTGINMLHNYRNELTHSWLTYSIGNSEVRPSEEVTIDFAKVRNISKVTVVFTPVESCPKKTLEKADSEDNYDLLTRYLAKNKALTLEKQFDKHAEYEFFNDSLQVGRLPLGTYLITFLCDGKEFERTKGLLYVSDLKVISLGQDKNKTRFVVVNATTGQPVANATLHIREGRGSKESTHVTDDKGEYIFNAEEYYSEICASYKEDKAMPFHNNYSNYSRFSKDSSMRLKETIFTDRGIYRPGQTVHASILTYSLTNGDETKVAPNRKVTVNLYDANYSRIANAQLTTDEYGVASTDFTLPENTLNGQFHISCGSANVYFRVEEYVRPTYDVSITRPDTNYKHGDTITVKGTAKMYSGVPVGNAQVVYTVKRQGSWWWARSNESNTELLCDTVMTDEAGNFDLKMPMIMPKDALSNETSHRKGWYYCPPRFFDIVAEATVTDMAGETHSATLSLPISNRTSVLSVSIEQKMLADKENSVIFTRRNQAGNSIKGTVSISIDGKKMKDVEAGEKWILPGNLASGQHTIEGICENDTAKQTFVLFSMTDKQPAVKTNDWWYQSASTFSEKKGEPVNVQFGIAKHDSYAVYSLFSDGRLIESGSVKIDSSLVLRQFEYKEEYGDGICYTVAWVKEGQVYTHSATIKRPLPDKNLRMKWSTFRNKLQPGQKEEWTLAVTDKNGKPADANVMATLYDKSLDAIKAFSWSFYDGRNINQPTASWDWHSNYGMSNTGRAEWKELRYSYPQFDSFRTNYLSLYSYSLYGSPKYRKSVVVGAGRRAKAMSFSAPMAKYDSEAMVLNEFYADSSAVSSDIDVMDAEEGFDDESSDDIAVRENLSETAFFLPNVRTDDKGFATLSFTLPESVTTWRLLAFANDKDLRHGMITDEVIAQKELMIQPRMPRFLREGDVCNVTASVANLSEDELAVNVKMVVIDAETEKTISTSTEKVSVKASQSAPVAFTLDSKCLEGKMLIVKMIADAGTFTDGEQHYLPILSSKEMMLDTRTIVMMEPGTRDVNLKDILPQKADHAHLTVEYTDAPEWLLIQSLPQIAEANDECIICLTASYYANTLAAHIARQNPGIESTIKEWIKDYTSLESALEKNEELKHTILAETPWLMDANNETAQRKQLYRLFDSSLLASRQAFALKHIQELQLSNGSFAWWKGMKGSPYMTLAVVKSLLRLENMTGKQSTTSAIITKAFRSLDKEIAEHVKEMKKEKKQKMIPYLSSFDLDYLYCRAISDEKMSGSVKDNVDFMLDYLVKNTRRDDMQTKANAAIILAKFGKKDFADEYIESIMEHTVYKEEMGRYFDSYRASYSWFDYRIPTQVSVIEALKALKPESRKDINDMQRWLLQSKRTQAWDTPINATNAIYAFMGNDRQLRQGMPANITLGTETLQPQKETSGLGYEKYSKDIVSTSAVDDAKNSTLKIGKQSEGESWANVYVKYLLPSTEATDAATGISIKRELSSNSLKIGDKVTVTITITADRDYDFVTVTDHRPACLEPVNQLSGYRNGCYQVMRDSQSQYHFDMLSKGTHTITTEYYVSKAGDFTSGTATAQCAYAPEFCGRTKGKSIKVNNEKNKSKK